MKIRSRQHRGRRQRAVLVLSALVTVFACGAIPDNDWHGQPTGMDISKDGRSAVILSYRAIYTFERDMDESWIEALQSTPSRRALGEIRAAEAVTFDVSGHTIFVTVEQKHAPLRRATLS